MKWSVKMSKLHLTPTSARSFSFVVGLLGALLLFSLCSLPPMLTRGFLFSPGLFSVFCSWVVKKKLFYSCSLLSISEYLLSAPFFLLSFPFAWVKMIELTRWVVNLGFKVSVVALLLFFTRNDDEGESDDEGALMFFCFLSFHLFLFDVMCSCLISPVRCVRVADIGFYFVPTRKMKLTMKVRSCFVFHFILFICCCLMLCVGV